MTERIGVGLDIGGTKVLGAVVDDAGTVLDEHRVPSPTGSWEGMLAALEMGLDTDIQIESLDTAEGRTFREIRNRDGLKAALAWRNARFADGKG